MGVFCNDFAAVDVREELCYPQPPEKAIREGMDTETLFKTDDHSEIIACKKQSELRIFSEVRIILVW